MSTTEDRNAHTIDEFRRNHGQVRGYVSHQPARLLCVCAPAGQEEFFMAVGSPVGSRTEPAPPLDAAAEAAFRAKAAELAPRYGTDLKP